jgi:hypothetical protein
VSLSRRDVMKVARQFIAWYRYENGNRLVEYGMIGSDRRATIRTINQPGVGIRPCPTGRILDWTRSRQSRARPRDAWLPSLVPSGQQTGSPVHIFDSRPHVREVYLCHPTRPCVGRGKMRLSSHESNYRSDQCNTTFPDWPDFIRANACSNS